MQFGASVQVGASCCAQIAQLLERWPYFQSIATNSRYQKIVIFEGTGPSQNTFSACIIMTIRAGPILFRAHCTILSIFVR